MSDMVTLRCIGVRVTRAAITASARMRTVNDTDILPLRRGYLDALLCSTGSRTEACVCHGRAAGRGFGMHA